MNQPFVAGSGIPAWLRRADREPRTLGYVNFQSLLSKKGQFQLNQPFVAGSGIEPETSGL